MGIIKGAIGLAYKGALYSLALCGAGGIFAAGYTGYNAVTREDPPKIETRIEQPKNPKEELSDVVKEMVAKEMMGESFRRIIEKRAEQIAEAKVNEYLKGNHFIEDLKKDPRYVSDLDNYK